MKILMLIPSVLKRDITPAVEQDKHPRMDYYALADALRQSRDYGSRIGQNEVALLDYGALEADGGKNLPFLVRLARRVAGRDAALAMLGFLRSAEHDTVFTNGENIGIPLALLLRTLRWRGRRRPGHVTIGHRLSTGKKRLFFRTLGVHREMDGIFVYATIQENYGRDVLGIPPTKLKRIAFHADDKFYRPSLAERAENESIVSTAGLEGRDYPTLLTAAARLPEVAFRMTGASPWSKRKNETHGRTLPANVAVRWYEYEELRQLYAESDVVAVPLYETDFQAGITTILEAMAMGKTVVVTRTTGQTDVITHGENGLLVPPNDPDAWEAALRLLLANPEERERLGGNARQWVEQHATLDQWADVVAASLINSCPDPQREATPGLHPAAF
ncbi:MAG: glycosyltransferase family 4 protein [Cytophagales bacterium]|nr:glycosyltransferase family 4 protein [Armatimonadota bacterium]